MSDRAHLQEGILHVESANEDGSMWSDTADTSLIRTPEEIEALIERLRRNLDERMANVDRRRITDSVSTLRRMRAARSCYLRRR